MNMYSWVYRTFSALYPYSYRGKRMNIILENKTAECFYQIIPLHPRKFICIKSLEAPLNEPGTSVAIKLEDLIEKTKNEIIILTVEYDGLVIQTDLKSRNQSSDRPPKYRWIVRQLPSGQLDSLTNYILGYCQLDITAFFFYSRFDQNTRNIIFRHNFNFGTGLTRSRYNKGVQMFYGGVFWELIQAGNLISLKPSLRYRRSGNIRIVINFLLNNKFYQMKGLEEQQLNQIPRLFRNRQNLHDHPEKIWSGILQSNIQAPFLMRLRQIHSIFNKYQHRVKRAQRKYRRAQMKPLLEHGFFGLQRYGQIVRMYLARLDRILLQQINPQCFNYNNCRSPIHTQAITHSKRWAEIRKILLQYYYHRKKAPDTPQIQFLCCRCHKQNEQRRKLRRRTMKQLRQIFKNFVDLFVDRNYIIAQR